MQTQSNLLDQIDQPATIRLSQPQQRRADNDENLSIDQSRLAWLELPYTKVFLGHLTKIRESIIKGAENSARKPKDYNPEVVGLLNESSTINKVIDYARTGNYPG